MNPRRGGALALAVTAPLLALGLLAGLVRAEAAPPPEPPSGDFSCQPFNSYNCTPERLAELEAYAARVNAAAAAGRPAGDPGRLNTGPTTFTLWHGENQKFGQVGNPQLWINLLGNVADPDTITKLEYSLNGGAVFTASLGPDDRRLHAPGDFNIEIAITDTALSSGTNQLVLTATDGLNNETARTVNFTYTAGRTWPASYSVNWGGPGELHDKVQVMDGLWSQSAAGVRTLVPSYDRAIAIGDMGWEQFEITLPITVHLVDAAAYSSTLFPFSGSPGLGIVLRWRGHTDSPVVCSQPHCGWLPWGGSAWYDWGFNGGSFKLNGDSSSVPLAADPFGRKLETGVAYYWKARVEEAPDGRSLYRMKVWKVDQPEPQHWDLSALGETNDLPSGSLVLVAHHVDATFGDLTITPGPFTDSLPPLIRDIRVARRDTSATVVWSTNEPATGTVEYGLTAGYGSLVSVSGLNNRQLRQVVTLSGLTPNTEYHYRVTARDAFNNAAQSVDLTFSTVGATSGFAASDLASDDFNRCALGGAWTLTDHYQDASLGLTGSYSPDARLSLGVPGGLIHPIGFGAVLAPRVWQPIADTDFEAVVRFDSPLTAQGQSQGLLIERDDASLLRVEFNANATSTRVNAVAYSGAGPSTRVSNTTVASLNRSPLYLRVSRQANQWTVAYSQNGADWTTAGSAFTQALAVTRLGVFAANSATAPDGGNAPAHTLQADYVFNGVAPLDPEDGARNTLTVNTLGQGGVAVNPVSPSYACGQAVTLTAAAEAGWGFAGWSGALNGSANPAQVSMSAPQAVTAAFLPVHPLTVTVQGSGAVSRTPDQSAYLAGSVVTLTATPAAGWAFAGWSGALGGSANPAQVSMSAPQAVTAAFIELLSQRVFLPVVVRGGP